MILFAILCTYNCLSIAAWERELDTAQGKASFLTGWPAVAGALQPVGYGIALAASSCAIFWRFAFSLWLCLAVSAFLLVRLNLAERLPRDSRTALADLVLLTPLVVVALLSAVNFDRVARIIAGSRRSFLGINSSRRGSRSLGKSRRRVVSLS